MKPGALRHTGTTVAHGMARIVALGAILAACSELWFYEIVTPREIPALIGVYGLLGYLMVATLRQFRVRGFNGFFLAAAAFGFMAEGILVPTLYQNIPFSLVWTPLAWHALLSASVGFLAYRRIMAAARPLRAAALNLAIGCLVGGWAAYSWNAVENDAAGTVTYTWHGPAQALPQLMLGWGLFVAGHWLFDTLPPPCHRPSRPVFFGLLGLAGTAFSLGPLGAFFPVSLVLPLALLLSCTALRHGQQAPATTWLEALFARRSIRMRRYWLSLLIPLGAAGTYATLWALRAEIPANVFLAGVTVPFSALLWLRSLLHPGRR